MLHNSLITVKCSSTMHKMLKVSYPTKHKVTVHLCRLGLHVPYTLPVLVRALEARILRITRRGLRRGGVKGGASVLDMLHSPVSIFTTLGKRIPLCF